LPHHDDATTSLATGTGTWFEEKTEAQRDNCSCKGKTEERKGLSLKFVKERTRALRNERKGKRWEKGGWAHHMGPEGKGCEGREIFRDTKKRMREKGREKEGGRPPSFPAGLA